MLYGFLGFHPRMDGCHIAPRLPDSWPSLTVRGIALHDVVLNVTATAQTIRMEVQGEPARPLRLHIPGAVESQVDLRPGTLEIALKDAPAR
jgi:trehalose/maltose hydrolase-like predicted phosphorylase